MRTKIKPGVSLATLPVFMPITLVDTTGKALTAGAALPDGEVRWVADPVMLTDTPTGDGRLFLASGAAHGELPLPLQANLDTSEWGHVGAENAGRITMIEFAHPRVRAEGVFADTERGREVAQAVADQNVRGISVDLRDVTWNWSYIIDEDGDIVGEEGEALTWSIDGATITPFPAFDDANVIVPDAVADPDAAQPEGDEEQPADEAPEDEDEATVRMLALTASGPRRPSPDLFDDPALAELTAPTFDETTGHYYGHLAGWDACHTSFVTECVMAPHSQASYLPFLTGMQLTTHDPVPVGRIVYGGGHAPEHLDWRHTAAYYDDIATSIARVNVGEDEHGIWFAGIIAPGVDDDMLTDFLAHPLSGDWRDWNGNLELLLACAVNAGGFVVPRVRMHNDRPVSLVASGGFLPVAKLMAKGCGCGHAAHDGRVDRLERSVAALRIANAEMRRHLATR